MIKDAKNRTDVRLPLDIDPITEQISGHMMTPPSVFTFISSTSTFSRGAKKILWSVLTSSYCCRGNRREGILAARVGHVSVSSARSDQSERSLIHTSSISNTSTPLIPVLQQHKYSGTVFTPETTSLLTIPDTHCSFKSRNSLYYTL